MEQELLCVPITPAKSVPVGPGLNPKCRVFADWEPAFGCARGAIDLNECPSSEGFAAGECSGGLGMNISLGITENSRNSGVGNSVLDREKMSARELLSFAVSGAPTGAGAIPEKHSGGTPDNDGINAPPTPVEKEQIFRKKRQQKVKTKKHRPKIFDESKPRRIPKPNPKRESEKGKYARKNSPGQPPGSAMRSRTIPEPSTLNPQTPKPLVEKRKRKDTLKASKHPLKSCKRGINFNLENNVEENNAVVETVSASAEELRTQISDCNIKFYANSSQCVDHKAAGKDMECTVNSSMHSLSLKLENKTANIYATNVISVENVLDEKRLPVGDNCVITLVGSLDDIGKETVDHAGQARMESLNYLGLNLKPVESSPSLNGGKEMMGVMNQNGCKSNSLQVYQRTFQGNKLIKESRNLGPNCPSTLKRKRTKRQRAVAYNLWFMNKDSKQKGRASKYALRSNSKQHSTFAINNFDHSVLPTKSQFEAAIADPESFKCSSTLCPIAKSRKKRSKRFPQSYTSHSPVTQSTMGKKSSDAKFLCHAFVSFSPVTAKRKKSGNLMQRQGLPSSNTITCNSQNNLTSASETLSIRSQGAEAFKLDASAEIPTYPPQCDDHLFDVEIHPHGDDNVLLAPMSPMEKNSSHANVELKIHPPHLESAPQEYLLPIAQRTSGSRSKFKVETCRLQHENAVSETDGSQDKFTKYLIESIIQQLDKLQINDEHGQLVVRDRNLHSAVLPYKEKFDTLKKRKLPKVDLDPETIRMWNLLMEKDASELLEDAGEKKKTNWEEQRELFHKRVEVFISCMHLLQGDRRFSPWKGSVVDSVVGVFLTQNVSDCLSSNAFMSLAAKFPAPSRYSSQGDTPCSQESTSNTTGLSGQQSHETFISSTGEKEPGSLEDERVEKNPPVNHDFSFSFPDKHPIVTHGPSTFEKSTALKELLEFKQTGNSEQMCLPRDVELPSFEDAVGTRLCSCESGIITSSADRLDDLNGAHVSLSLSASSNPDHNGCNVDDNLGFECDFGEHTNKNLATSEEVNENCGSKNYCACVRGMLDEVARASANSNTLLNKLEVAMEDNTVSLSSTRLEENGSISQSLSRSREKKGKVTKMPKPNVNWEKLRRTYYNPSRTPGRNLDSVDWDAVRRAPVEEIAKVIENRGMNNVLAAKIKAFLDRLVEDHGSIDLEWLKDVPPDKAKEFLLSIRGVGLKSAECVRLLTLGHLAFPVDTNIARIAVRLGWVPLEPLPGGLQIHLLEQYPQMDSIQKYIWPRLCTLDKNILYVLHYQLITFGKVICTKKNPNCNACPMRADCRHFASAFASSRLRLRGAPERSVVISKDQVRDDGISNSHLRQPMLPLMERDIEDFPCGLKDKDDKCYTQTCAPVIEILASPEAEPTGALEIDTKDFPYELDDKDEKSYTQTCEPIIEIPASPEPESTESLERDTDDIPYESEDEDEIPHFRLDTKEFKRNLLNFLNPEFQEEEVSNALVALTPKATTIPAPKIKSVERLRTKHRVYILPDSHQLLAGFEQREHDDPCPYLLAIWPKETLNQSRKQSSSQESVICDGDINSPGIASRETNDQTVCGTILIPCRTANKGSFPLNGTYFQVNEVFADHESSECPINVPRKWIWALDQRNLYCGSTASAIARGMEMHEIQHCFWNGFICVRAFDRRTRNPQHLAKRFHELPSVVGKKKILNDD